MANCVVSGTVLDPTGTAISGASVYFSSQNMASPGTGTSQGSTTTASNGSWSLSLQQGISGIFSIPISASSGSRPILYTFSANIPSQTTATFSSVIS